MEGVLKTLARFVYYFAEILAAVVIIMGMIQGAWKYILYIIKREKNFNDLIESRLKVGHSLSLGLAFLVGADIVKTAVDTEWHTLIHLGGVVFIRIVLNYFLMKDIEQLKSEQSSKE